MTDELSLLAGDHRPVPLETVRDFARREAELSSIRSVAEDAGVGRSTLHTFITAGSMPHPRVRRLLALWYLRGLEGVNERELVRPYVKALRALLADMPGPSRGRLTQALLHSMVEGCADVGEQPPRWVEVLRTRLFRKATNEEQHMVAPDPGVPLGGRGIPDAELLTRWLAEPYEDAGATSMAVFLRYRDLVRTELERAGLAPLDAVKRVAIVFMRAQGARPDIPADTPLRERLLIVAREVGSDPEWTSPR